MLCPPGFIGEVTELLAKRLPNMNKDYLQGIAEVLLSSVSWQASVTDQLGKLNFNIWIQMIAPSGDGKTIPIDNFLIPTMTEVEKLMNTKEARYVLYLANYTGEALMRYFANNGVQLTEDEKGKKVKEKRRTIYNLGLLCKDEATMALQNAIKKNYMVGIIEVESKVYDGKLYRKITTGRGLEDVEKCFKASISATTPAIYELMKNDGFIQGGWNRYDVIVGNPLKPEDVQKYDDDFFIPQSKLSEFTAVPKNIADKLIKLAKSEEMIILLDEKANVIWREYAYEMKIEVVKLEDKDLRRGYLQRQAEKALKRAGLYTISKSFEVLEHCPKVKQTIINEEGEPETVLMRALICEYTEMEMAISNQREYYKYWLKMLQERKNTPPESKVQTNQAEREWFALSAKREPILSRKMLIEFTQWNDGDRRLNENISSAISEGKLKMLTEMEVRQLCNLHRGDLDWFAHMHISPSFKNIPHLYEWIQTEQNT
jgi:hypothetical protein